MTSLLLILLVILVFNFMIFIHELGHFLAAKWRGMYVDRFQIWFGKPIFKVTYRGVQYGLGTVPLGGFVSIPDMAPMDAIEGETLQPYTRKPVSPLDKIIVAFAGPLFSFLLAFASALLVWKVGKIELPITSTEIGFVTPGSPAEKAGFLAGDNIVSIEGDTPQTFNGSFNAVTTMIALSEGEEVEFTVKRPGVEELIDLSCGYTIPETKWYERKAMRRVGIWPKQKVFIGSVMENSPAQDAGLQAEDQILKVNGKTVHSFGIIQAETKDANKPVAYTVVRKGEEFTANIQPEYPDQPVGFERKMIGVTFGADPGVELVLAHPTPIEQIKEASTVMWVSLTKVISKATSLDVQHFSGPIGIGKSMFDMLSIEDGWKHLIWFLVIFNINLAIFNLLPIPVLDGGHIVLAMVEWVTGKEPHFKFLQIIQTGVFAALFTLFIFIGIKDVGDLLRPKSNKAEVKFFPKSAPTDNLSQ